MELNINLGTVTNTVTQVMTNTDPFTAEDVAYAREKYIGQGFDYEAAQAPDTQKKVGRLPGIKASHLQLQSEVGLRLHASLLAMCKLSACFLVLTLI